MLSSGNSGGARYTAVSVRQKADKMPYGGQFVLGFSERLAPKAYLSQH